MRLIPLLTTAVMLAATLSAAPVSAADPAPALTIFEPYGTGSAADRIIDLLRPSLEKSLKHPVKVEHAGDAALDKTAGAAPDGNTVVVVALLPHEIAEATGKGATKLSALTPVAKLTGPGSGTLVVPKGSPIKNWADFVAAARARPLSIASPGRSSAAGVPIAFMERALNVQFKDVVAPTHQAILDAMAAKSADAAFVVTLTLQPGLLGGPPLHPIVTFGAKRGTILPDVPTFIEAIGPQQGPKQHNAITSAIALFGPPGMQAATIQKLVEDFTEAAKAAKQSGSILAKRVPLEVGDAALLRETMERDKSVIQEVISLLH
jgi:tripartite-type tricarboxylate transporter receptor subunit TctC